MTREQASNAIDEPAESGYAGPVAVYLNSVGNAFVGTVVVNDVGLLVVDGGRVFVRCEQASAIEVASWARSDFAIRSHILHKVNEPQARRAKTQSRRIEVGET
jgi:hypothetical protein